MYIITIFNANVGAGWSERGNHRVGVGERVRCEGGGSESDGRKGKN